MFVWHLKNRKSKEPKNRKGPQAILHQKAHANPTLWVEKSVTRESRIKKNLHELLYQMTEMPPPIQKIAKGSLGNKIQLSWTERKMIFPRNEMPWNSESWLLHTVKTARFNKERKCAINTWKLFKRGDELYTCT